MRIITILILLMVQLLSVMATSVATEVQDTDAENELAAIAPNDFNAALNYSYEEIDRHALSAPASVEGSVEICSAGCADDGRTGVCGPPSGGCRVGWLHILPEGWRAL